MGWCSRFVSIILGCRLLLNVARKFEKFSLINTHNRIQFHQFAPTEIFYNTIYWKCTFNKFVHTCKFTHIVTNGDIRCPPEAVHSTNATPFFGSMIVWKHHTNEFKNIFYKQSCCYYIAILTSSTHLIDLTILYRSCSLNTGGPLFSDTSATTYKQYIGWVMWSFADLQFGQWD